MFDRFSEKSIKAVVLAQQECRRYCHNSVGSEHILLGLIGEPFGAASRLLKSKVDIRDVRDKIEALVGRGMSPPLIEIPFTPRVKAVLAAATQECDKLGHAEIDTGHILYALLPEDHLDENAGSVAARVLEDLGVDCAQLRQQMIEILKAPADEFGAETPLEEVVFADSQPGKDFACPHCRETIKIGASYCRHCRRNPDDRYKRCADCAEWIQEIAKACHFCSRTANATTAD